MLERHRLGDRYRFFSTVSDVYVSDPLTRIEAEYLIRKWVPDIEPETMAQQLDRAIALREGWHRQSCGGSDNSPAHEHCRYWCELPRDHTEAL
jgi:hypothetical protein